MTSVTSFSAIYRHGRNGGSQGGVDWSFVDGSFHHAFAGAPGSFESRMTNHNDNIEHQYNGHNVNVAHIPNRAPQHNESAPASAPVSFPVRSLEDHLEAQIRKALTVDDVRECMRLNPWLWGVPGQDFLSILTKIINNERRFHIVSEDELSVYFKNIISDFVVQ